MELNVIAMNIFAANSAQTTSTNQMNPWLQYVASYFPVRLTNIQQLAMSAMTPPLINNRTLIDLYSEAYEIVNATGADSVLLEMDPLNKANGSSSNGNDYGSNNQNKSIVVLAVKKPNVPSHEDLMKKFNYYFVNLTESPLPNDSDSMTKNFPSQQLEYVHPTVWQIFIDFLRNQANALLGALMIPINVSANAILKSTQTHAEYVMSGSSLGSFVSAPVILKSISIPNIVAQRITDMASHQLNHVDSFGQQAKTITDVGIQILGNSINNGTYMVSDAAENAADAADHWIIRPIGAFTGFHLNQVGDGISQIGQSFTSTGINIHLFGQRIGSDAVKLVSAGATAVAWGLDDTVAFNQKKNNGKS